MLNDDSVVLSALSVCGDKFRLTVVAGRLLEMGAAAGDEEVSSVSAVVSVEVLDSGDEEEEELSVMVRPCSANSSCSTAVVDCWLSLSLVGDVIVVVGVDGGGGMIQRMGNEKKKCSKYRSIQVG